MEPEELSESGSPIYRHKPRDKAWEPANMEGSSSEEIQAHVTEHIGPIETVWHEIVSDLVHIDVHYVPPNSDRDYITLVTTGMSDKPMALPDDVEGFRYAELLIHLPADWPMTKEAFEDENNYWPIRWLKQLARFPHEYDTWLGYGHTVPNGDPPEPFASQTPFSCMLVELPVSTGEGLFQLEVSDEKTICFYSLVPLYLEEMNLKLKKGLERLEHLFYKHGIGDVVDVQRPNVARSRFRGLFGQ